MPNYRIDRISEEVRHVLDTLIRQLNDPRIDGTWSVTRVEVTRDLRYAKTYVSIFPSAKASEVMGILNDNVRIYRGELGHRIGKQLRIVPDIDFFLDTTLDYAEYIEELLRK